MPLHFSTSAAQLPNQCLECGEQCKRPKRFCSDSHKEAWLASKVFALNHRGIAQVKAQREQLGITPEALDFRRKLSVTRPF